MTQSEIVKKFSKRIPNRRYQNRVVWKGSNVFCEDEIIYSYGENFPMAKYLGEKNKKPLFIKNSDKYSSSTSAHQSKVREFCFGPSVSRSKLHATVRDGIQPYFNFEDLTLDNIHLWRAGCFKHLWQDVQSNRFYADFHFKKLSLNDPDPVDPFVLLDTVDVSKLETAFNVVNLERRVYILTELFKLSKIGKFKAFKRQEDGRFKQGTYSIEEVLVLKIDNHYILCSGDKVAKLSGEPKTIAQALKMKTTVTIKS